MSVADHEDVAVWVGHLEPSMRRLDLFDDVGYQESLGLPLIVGEVDVLHHEVRRDEIRAGDDYSGSQRWAHGFHQAGFAGVWYSARHDVRGGLHSLALFGKPGHQPDALLCYSDEPIRHALIDEAAATFGIEVLPSVSL